MAVYAGIEKEISADTPCGPDPDIDAEAQNFLTVAEGQLPASYRSFNKKSFESKQTLADLHTQLEKSRDLRYLVLAAKYHILSDDLPGFVDAVAATNALLMAQWDHCHPTEAAGGAMLRSAYLKSLDDLPTVVLPLQSATLINDKRHGPLSMRSVLVGEGKLPPREGETTTEASGIKDAFLRFEPLQQLVDLTANLETLLASLESLRQLFIDKAGHEAAPQFEQLPDLVRAIRAYVSGIVTTREPSLAPAQPAEAENSQEGAETAAAPLAPSDVASVKEASSALAAILAYYAGKEPSSPARLLLKQAHQLVGKSFVEVMKTLAPGLVEKAKIQIGGSMPFALNFAQLSALAVEEGKPEETEAEARSYIVSTRGEATALMRQVEIFYNNIEPSSPIPMLIEKARTLVAKDFNALLMEISRKDEKKDDKS